MGLNQSPGGGQFLSPQMQAGSLNTPPNKHNRSTSTASGMDMSNTSQQASPAMTNGELGGMGNSFQHPFVPQDLWQMPMTLEWDWAGMTDYSGGFDEGQGGAQGGSGLEASGVISGLPTSGAFYQNGDSTNPTAK